MKQQLFITATGTEIGKTFITSALARQARARGISVAAFKPILSGFDPQNADETDAAILLKSLGQPLTQDNIDRIAPWRFRMPLTPAMAARAEHRAVDFDELITFSRRALNGAEELALIEGVGGVMAPITEHHTVLEWIAALDIPALLITGSYLGTLSHTLTAIEAIKARGLTLAAIIVNESPASTVSLHDTAAELRRWVETPVVTVTRRGTGDQVIPELDWLLS